MNLVVVIAVALLLPTVKSYRVAGSDDEHTPFVPYEKGFVGEYNADSMIHPRVNPGFDSIFDWNPLLPNRLQTCPGMIGPGLEGRFYCTGKDNGDCDRRSGVCFCNQGYAGDNCSECAPFFHQVGGKCYEKVKCPNDCSNAGQCNYFTGTCTCNQFRLGNDCSQFTCSRFHEYCTKCNNDQCLECIQGFGLTSNGTCDTCSRFDPRCFVCDEDRCLDCIDLLLLSIRRSGRRSTDPELPFDELSRQLSSVIPFGSQQSDAFDEAEDYRLVLSDVNDLSSLAMQCDQGTNSDASLDCKPAMISHKVCGHEGVFRFSSPLYYIHEDAGHIRITVERSGGGVGGANVSYALNHITTNTNFLDVSPTAMYTMDQTLHFMNHEVQRSFLLPIHNDIMKEGNETFEIFLYNPSGDSSLGTQSRAIITIIDDDAPDKYCCGDEAYFSIDTTGATAGIRLHYEWCVTENGCQIPQFFFEGIDRKSDERITHHFHTYDKLTQVEFPELHNIDSFDIHVYQIGQGLTGSYFSSAIPSHSTYLFSRVDATVNFTFTQDIGLSTIWKGFVKKPPDVDECCTFTIQSMAVRFWIDGYMLIDEWNMIEGTSMTSNSGYHSLKNETLHELVLEVRHNNYENVKFMWNAFGYIDIIPASYLFGHSEHSIGVNICVETFKNVTSSGWTSMRDLILDETTRRLLELTLKSERSEDDIDEILFLIQQKAPKLLDSLSDQSKANIAKSLLLKCYDNDEVVFNQNDEPDAYYAVIRGAVSIYVHQENNHPRTGKFLMQLPPGTSFGELSFNADYNHSLRNAGVVSDGAHGQSKIQIYTGTKNEGSYSEIDASDVAVLLLIPEKTYMEELYARHASKHLTKEKVAFLKSSILFSSWPMDDLVKMAYTMKKKNFAKGAIVVPQGEYIENVILLKKGKLSVYMKIFKSGSSNMGSSSNLEVRVDIAQLNEGDIFGMIEAIENNCKKTKREATAGTDLETFVIPVSSFLGLFRYQEKTLKLMKRVAQKRTRWELLRREYALRFSNAMPLSLPKIAKELSNYHLSSLSILSKKQLVVRSHKENDLNRIMREIRLLFKSISVDNDSRKQLELACQDAIRLSVEIKDKVKENRAQSILQSIKSMV